MKNVILFDTSAGTLNHGDEIIMESLEKNMKDVLDGKYVLKFPTHTPCFHFYQQTKKNPRYKFVTEADYKFICGTNILNNKMLFPWPFWNINIFNSKCNKDSVLVGVGCAGFEKNNKVNLYSKALYSSILSRKYKHSVRDERTKNIVESIIGEGSAINTGCVTTWGLTKEHCSGISAKKAKNVVFTLTDYAIDREADTYLINTLIKNYEKVYFWPQGTRDVRYFSTLKPDGDVTMISPGVRSYYELLNAFPAGELDYVGTRLHAGIYAMQSKVRAVIIKVDNRADDMSKTYNINTVERDNRNLCDIINSDIVTDINIDTEKIKEWKSQFK